MERETTNMSRKKRVGILALQGAFAEHALSLQKLGAEAIAVRQPHELKKLDGLILPGGETTTISYLLMADGFTKLLRELGTKGFPIFGTCAGMILLAKNVPGLNTDTLGVMNIKVERNSFGRQVNSFEIPLRIAVLGEIPYPAVFIRAPVILEAETEVEILAHLPNGTSVAARQGNLLVSAFHPELTSDGRFHSYFLDIITRYS
jgi:5'-phosphate synthase pdxT subunit